MSWASSRRTFIVLLLVGAAVLVIAGFLIATFYNPPSCSDGKQNQDEEGIDCGGSCALLCTPSVVPPVVSFVRELPQQGGRLDIIAYIKNPNPFAAAKDVRYEIEFLGENGTPVGSTSGRVDLPPAANVPIFIPNALSAGQFVRQSFLTFDEASFRWYEIEDGELDLFTVEDITTANLEESPRVTAILNNPSVHAYRNVKVVATVFDTSGNAMAASQTLVASLPAQGEAPLVFTWNTPFREAPARIDITPVYELP
ncbi:MAG TPA: hypothetical protein VEB18_00550 [Candidatus Paceibacterota bacterium]|nr:hypothetical protein [Candidatus Paceibacterota bacterium]